MKCSKKVLAFAAAGALTAATAVPALAMENEIHGMFRTYFNDSNLTINPDFSSLGGTLGPFNGVDGHRVVSKAEENANFFETRLRINYTAKLNDDVKVVSRFETNYYYWGNSNYTAHRAGGGALGSRGVNIETKQVYLDLNTPSVNLNTKVGMQPWTDDYSGIFVDGDMPGVVFSHNYEKGGVSAGFFRWDDAGAATDVTYGHNTRDLYILNGKYEISKELKVGAAYYFLNSDRPNGNPGDVDHFFPMFARDNFQLHMLGLNAEGTLGPVALNGFFTTQLGHDHISNRDIQAFAANAGARMAVGPGTARASFLYTSGDNGKGKDSSFRVGSLESDYYDNHMTVLGRNQYAMVNDNAVVFDANNNGQGVLFGAVGYDFPITKDLAGSVNLGAAAVDTDGWDATTSTSTKPINLKTGAVNKSDYLGTELNAELNYKLNTFTTLTLVGGYVVLGDYFKDTAPGAVDPNNVYDGKLVVTVAF